MSDDDPPPDLQALVRKAGMRYAKEVGEEYEPNIHGGYQHIIPAEWAEWDYLNAQWQMRRRLKYRR